MNKVLVLDTNRKPLMPCHPRRARKLLESGRASVFRRYPFTIILHDRIVEESELQDIEIKIDQGSKTTGIALIVHGNAESTVAFAAHVEHRIDIKSKLDSRRAVRRSRRNRKTRYRAPRFLNRAKPKGWLPPSVRSKADNILNWVNRFRKLVPISRFALETAKFDTQKLENPEIQGDGYQQGKLYGYEDKRAYLFEREKGCCVYCGNRGKMEVEHVVPRSRGGTDNGVNVKVDPRLKPLVIKATGRGSRQFCRMNKYGFPRTKAKPRSKNFFGFKTGDMVKVVIPTGSRNKAPAGTYIGRVVVRSTGSFAVSTRDAKIIVSHKYCKLLHQMDGYAYED